MNFDWHNFSYITALIIFIAYLVVDGMYAYYTLAITKHKAITAATTGALMHFLLAFGVINYVNNYLYVVPLALGSWIGTFLVIKRYSLLRKKHH
jgi:hypothetical protein